MVGILLPLFPEELQPDRQSFELPVREKSSICMGQRMQKAYAKLKYSLSDDIVLCFPDYTRPFAVVTDASNFAIGAVIANVMEDGTEQPTYCMHV